ncbi:Myelin regulatory factor [Aphelenchoides bicaudatus]|nr:Myelin regulatory factor [Aphelenchoides bicaudatus]
MNRKRRRMEPMGQIKCEEVYVMANQLNNNQCLLSNSSTNSSNNENAAFDYPLDEEPGSQRMIKFNVFQSQQWAPLFDANQCQLPLLNVSVVADKGFSYAPSISCFVNQKKNHLQITMMVKTATEMMPKYVYTNEAGMKEVRHFKLDVCGIKAESPTSEIPMRQSLSNRKTIPYEAEIIELEPNVSNKKTCYRLHLAEVTSNNNRKENKQPNPAQRYFHLVAKLLAECTDGSVVTIQAHVTDRFVCRASNPKTFEEPKVIGADITWQRANNTLHYEGPVAVGTDKSIPGAALTVIGNIVSTGQSTRPSDRRVKEDIIDIDTREALERLAKIRLVEYSYKPEMAEQWGLTEEERHRVGVIAQELAEIMPDAVKDNGEFLTVDDSRIFYDAVAAQQQLHKVSGNLGGKIEQVEELSVKVARYLQKRRKELGSMASGLSDLSTLLANYPKKTETNNEHMDTKSCVSQSHLSLISTTAPSIGASQIGSASQYGKYYSRKGRLTSRDSDLCNSRLTQATMVGLIVVMSICLVSMCTLYVLDWYNRTYVYNHNKFPIPDQTHGFGNIIELTNWLPPKQPLVKPLLSDCVGALGSNCTMYCCAADRPTTNAPPKWTEVEETKVSLQELLVDGDNASPKPLFSGVRIQLVDLNISLDAKYCVDKSCQPKSGRYNLYIPMGPYLPTIPLHIKFSIDPELQIDACGQYAKLEPKSCKVEPEEKNGLVPSISKVNGDTFVLSAGRFRQSAYQFRIGHTADACQMPEEQQGRSFDEYNLIFYRKCESPKDAVEVKGSIKSSGRSS